MLCFRCGSPVSDGAGSCENCGQDLSSSTSADNTEKFAEIQKKLRQTDPGYGRISDLYREGEVVAERYEVVAEVGKGVLGTVYKAFDQEVEAHVVLKVIGDEFLPDDQARDRFVLALQRARDLSHDGAVRYLDVDRDGDRCFYVTQYLEGLTLRKIIDLRKSKGQRFSVDEVVPIYSQLCRVLGGTCRVMAHGGLKPENVFILPEQLKVTDFGLPEALPMNAYLAAQRRDERATRYLAPEIRDQQDFDARADVYSIAVILTELLTGEAHETGNVAIHAQLPDIPEAFDDLLGRALDEDPHKRPGDASALGQELSSILIDSPVGARLPDEAMEAPATEGDEETTSKIAAKDLSGEKLPAEAEVEVTEPRATTDGTADGLVTSAVDYSDPAVPPPAKEPSQITHQLEVDDIEFASQSGQVSAPEAGSEEAEDEILTGPPISTGEVEEDDKTTRVSQEELERQHDEDEEPDPLLDEEIARAADEAALATPEGPPPERTQQIDAEMIMEGEDGEEQEEVVLVPPGDLNHSQISGETSSDDIEISPEVEPAQEPSYQPLSQKAMSEEAKNREARAREALQAFDFDATLQEAVESAAVEPEQEEVPLPKGVDDDGHRVLTSEDRSAVRGTLEIEDEGVQQPELELEDEDRELSVTQAVARPQRPAKHKLVPFLIVGFILVLVGGTVGAILYIQKLRSDEALRELELKRMVALKALGSTDAGIKGSTSEPGEVKLRVVSEGGDASATIPVPTPLRDDAGPATSGRASAADAAAAVAPKDTPSKRLVARPKDQARPRPKAKGELPVLRPAAPKRPSARPKPAAPRLDPRPAPPPKQADSKKCPAGLRYIPGRAGEDGYCIDRYESPGRGRVPRRANLAKARGSCRARGLRLCSAKEWIRACGGLFPYGRKYNQQRCNTGSKKLVPAGSKRRCRSRWGLYDMSGNVAEWVAEGTAMGGDAKSTEGHAGCLARSAGGALTGFRCCSDPEWD